VERDLDQKLLDVIRDVADQKFQVQRTDTASKDAVVRIVSLEVQLGDLKEKFVKAAVGTEYLLTNQGDRLKLLEADQAALKLDMARILAVADDRNRQEATGSHAKAEQSGNPSLLKQVLDNNKILLQFLLMAATVVAVIVQWLTKG